MLRIASLSIYAGYPAQIGALLYLHSPVAPFTPVALIASFFGLQARIRIQKEYS